MIPLGEAIAIGTATAAAVIPHAHRHFTRPVQDVSFKGTRQNGLGLVDHFIYEEIVEPDTILTTYGALGAMYEIVWHDTSTLSDRDQIQHCAWVNDAHMKIAAVTTAENGWMQQSYTVPLAAPPLAVPKYLMSDGRRVLVESHIEFMAGKRIVLRELLAFTYMPPKAVGARTQNFFVAGDIPVESNYGQVQAEFVKTLRAVEDSIARVGHLRRLGTHPADSSRNELLETILHLVLDEQQPIVLGEFEPQSIGGLLASSDITPGLYPKVGNKHVRMLSIYGAPLRTKPGMMDAFLQAAIPGCRLATRAIYQDALAAQKRLKKMRGQWSSQRPQAGKGKRDNRHAAAREDQVDAELQVAATQRVAHVHWNAKAVLFNEDEARMAEDIRVIRKALQGEGFTVKIETINAVEAYFGAAPFDGYHDVREAQIHTANVARMVSTNSSWKGRTSWGCKNCGPVTVPALIGLTKTREDFAIDPHDEDSQSFLVLGPPGSGKTVLINKLSADYIRAANDRVYGIDKNFGQFVTCSFLGGKYYDAQRYWLFGGLENPQRRNKLAKFLANLVKLNGVEIEQHKVFGDTLELMLDDSAKHRSLSTFLNLLGPVDKSGRIMSVLGDYASGGIHGGIFDGSYDPAVGDAQHEVHELGALMAGNTNESVSAPALLWLLESIAERLPGTRSIIPIDEAWAPIKAALVANVIEEMLRTLRYRHSGIGFFTHSIDEVKRNPIGKTVVAACKTRILFPNPDASSVVDDKDPESNFYVNSLQLTPAQIQSVRTGTPKRDAFFCGSGDRFGPYSNPLSPAEAAVYGCTGDAEVKAARRLMIEFPTEWRERHLSDAGCKREADQLRSLRRNHITNRQTVLEALR